MTTNAQSNLPGNTSQIESLTKQGNSLSHEIDSWNAGYVLLGALALFVAFWIFFAQWKIIRKGKELSGVQTDLIAAKDRQALVDSKDKDERIADARREAATSNEAAGKANEAAKQADERAMEAQASLALAEQHSAEANAKAEGFRLSIASANEVAAKATAEAAKATLELAKFKTPRNLTKEQQERIAAKVGKFPDTPFDLWVSTDSDSPTLMRQIKNSLDLGKWKYKVAGTVQYDSMAGLIADSGVSIRIADEHKDVLEKPALELANALITEGIPIKIVWSTILPVDNDKDRTAIHVMVGSKPLD